MNAQADSRNSSGIDAAIQAMLDERARTMVEFTPDHRALNQYAIFRADLEMGPSKLAAQCGHAYQLAMEMALAMDPGSLARYKGSGNGTKIVMYVRNQGQLLRAYREALDCGAACALVIDRGHVLAPHFDGQPIITAIGIGPVYRDEIAHITKRCTMAS